MQFKIKNGDTVKTAKNAERAAWRILWFLKKSNKPSQVFIENKELNNLFIDELDEENILKQLKEFEKKVIYEKKKINSTKSAKILLRRNPNHFRDIVNKRWEEYRKKNKKDL